MKRICKTSQPWTFSVLLVPNKISLPKDDAEAQKFESLVLDQPPFPWLQKLNIVKNQQTQYLKSRPEI